MKPVALFGMPCSGHDIYAPRPNVQASPTVFANAVGIQRFGDAYMPHCSITGCHSAVIAEGSATVFIESLPAARFGDMLSCGSIIAQGSPNVFIGG